MHFIYFFGGKNKIYKFKSLIYTCMVTPRNNCIFTLHHKSAGNDAYLACDNNFLISTLELRNFSSIFLVIVWRLGILQPGANSLISFLKFSPSAKFIGIRSLTIVFIINSVIFFERAGVPPGVSVIGVNFRCLGAEFDVHPVAGSPPPELDWPLRSTKTCFALSVSTGFLCFHNNSFPVCSACILQLFRKMLTWNTAKHSEFSSYQAFRPADTVTKRLQLIFKHAGNNAFSDWQINVINRRNDRTCCCFDKNARG